MFAWYCYERSALTHLFHIYHLITSISYIVHRWIKGVNDCYSTSRKNIRNKSSEISYIINFHSRKKQQLYKSFFLIWKKALLPLSQKRIFFIPQGEEVQQGRRGAGVILVTGDSLVLQKVGRQGGGTYSCSAANTKGTETSNMISLNVLCECWVLCFLPIRIYLIVGSCFPTFHIF